MSKDTIYRQEAIDAIDSLYFDTVDDHDRAKERIKRLASAQPEIIYCKDCKYYTSVTARCEVRGKGLHLIRGMEDFCSRAERRTDETD